MVTDRDEIIRKIRNTIKRDWKLMGTKKDNIPRTAIVLDNGAVQIDPRYTTHA